MEFTFDPVQILDALAPFQNPFYTLWYLFIHGGFLLILAMILRGLWYMWVSEVQGAYVAGVPKILLAVRVPRQTEQTPKAVENIFTHLTGTASGPGNWTEAYWKGKVPDTFSIEIVSRGGFIQYFIHAPVSFRDVIEASIYAQYPDAEVVEVADYAKAVPQKYPDENYDTWGTEVTLAKPFAYPLKTYAAFEHTLDSTFKDPLNSLFEFLTLLKDGEEVWIQFVLEPTSDSWTKTSESVVRKVIGAKEPPKKKTRIQKIGDTGIGITNVALGQISPAIKIPVAEPPKKKEGEAPNNLAHMTPAERTALEQIQIKASKPGYWAKMRICYVAPKTVFSKGRIATGVLGAYRQFGSQLLNSFKPFKYTKQIGDRFRKKQAAARGQNAIFSAYVNRSMDGGPKYILNVEELATLWHFPMIDTKVPMIQRSETKTAEPPFALPMRSEMAEQARIAAIKPKEKLSAPSKEKAPVFVESDVPANLPFA